MNFQVRVLDIQGKDSTRVYVVRKRRMNNNNGCSE
jgi:hypothetical protein